MPIPTESTENRIQDSIMAEMLKIGTAGGTWLTLGFQPYVAATIPTDPVPQAVPGPPVPADWVGRVAKYQVYVQYSHTDMMDAASGTATRRAQAHYDVICMGLDGDLTIAQRMMLNLRADVLRAVYAAEGTFYSVYKYGIWVGTFNHRPELSGAGVMSGSLDVFVDFDMSLQTP